MDWIKRNLYFLIGGVVALALMGMAGWFLYSKWQLNNEEMAKLNGDYEELKRLNSENPHPGAGQVNNIKIAQQQRDQVRALIQKARAKFQPIPPIPDEPKVTDRGFSAALSRTLDQLQKGATNSSVMLPPNYLFSFSAQNSRVSFAAGSLDRLAVQLGEVRTISEILFRAKVNSLDNIRRERVSNDDSSGPLTDYFDKKSVTNDLAVLSPYEVSFKCFSADLANVLAGFAASPHGIIVKAINVDPAPAPAPAEEAPPPVTPIYVQTQQAVADQSRSDADAAARFRSRYGIGARGSAGMRPMPAAPQPQTVYVQPTASAAPKSNQPVLDERQLKVTLTLNVVKLKPETRAETKPAPPARPQPAQEAQQ